MRVAPEHHMNDEQIENYSMGRIAEEECERCEEHLLICESCQNRVTEMDEYILAIAAAGSELRRQPRRPKWTALFSPRWAPMLATAAVAILLALGIRLADRGMAPTAISISLEATRGAGIAARIPAGRPIELGVDLSGLPQQPAYRLSVVDQSGRERWTGTVEAHDTRGTAAISRLDPGVYFVRVYGASATLLREYGFEVRQK